MRKSIYILAATLMMAPAVAFAQTDTTTTPPVSSTAPVPGVDQGKEKLGDSRRDTRDIRHDRRVRNGTDRKLARERVDARGDRREMKQDKASGDKAGYMNERRDMRRDHSRMERQKDRRNHMTRDMRRDKRDRHGDRHHGGRR